jgi:hypothetical protein
MKTITMLILLALASCRGLNGVTGSDDSRGNCGGSVNSSWVDDGGATLDLTHLNLAGPVTSQWETSSGLYQCQGTFITSGTSCSGTITVINASMISGPAGGFSSQCEQVDGIYTYNIVGGRLQYGKQGSAKHSYH